MHSLMPLDWMIVQMTSLYMIFKIGNEQRFILVTRVNLL